MEQISLLLKSYAGDLRYARRLVTSFLEHNVTGLTLHCVVPNADLTSFAPMVAEGVTLHAEEELFGSHLVRDPIGDLRVGYANQEIVKLAFWEAGLAANYFCIDSDAVILRDFTAADFMYDDNDPFTVLVEDNDLKVEPRYYAEHWIGREKSLRKIVAEVGLTEPLLRTAHGHQVMSSRVLRSLHDELLKPRGWDYLDLLAISPYEFSWYSMWLQSRRPIAIHQREPLVKVFHNEDQYLASQLAGITQSDLARGYLAVVVNSNFSRDLGPITIGGDKISALVPHLSYGETAKLVGAKLRDSAKRHGLLRQKPPLNGIH